MSKNQKLELTWIGKNEPLKLEPRILIEDKSKSYGDPNTQNMIIHGDNLLALKALEKKYTGEVKCIYIDPPYNTGSAFEHYNDNVEHSTWLSLMRDRLIILRNLLKTEGIICIHCDDSEQAYLKILCDEIFERNNFLNMLVIETGEVFGTKAAHIEKTFVKVKDYILIYSKSKNVEIKIKPLWTKTNELFDSHYSNVIINLKKENIILFMKNINWIVNLFIKYDIVLKISNISKMMELDEKFKKYINEELAENIYQDQPYNQNIPNEILKQFDEKVIVEYNNLLLFKTSSGSIRYYKSFYDAIHNTDDYINEKTRSTARGDLWKNYHTDMRNINDEGGVKFKSSKKPERLIRDILYSFTNENDLVLDSFLGSGTTCAVAQKMNRRYIGVELGEHCYTHCMPRLKKVIDGEDKGGITKSVNWQGGGGYKFYELAPSLINQDKFRNNVISEFYNTEMLAEAMAIHEGFTYSPDSECYFKQGKSSENSYIFTTTNFITVEYLANINNELKENETLLICCKSFNQECEGKYNNIIIKKIPHNVLGKCEFGSKDYNLNVIEETEIDNIDYEGEENDE